MQSLHLDADNPAAPLVVRDAPPASPGPHDVRVRVHAVSLNRRDLMIRAGTYPVPLTPGVVPVSDGAGEVIEVGHAVTRAVLTSEPRDVSFLFFLSYLRWGKGLESLISIKDGAQQNRFVGGAQQISQRLAERVAPRVVLDCPVHQIEQLADGVIVRSERGAWHARLAIVALPPVLAGRIHYSAALPARRDQITARMLVRFALATPSWPCRRRSRGE